MASFDNLPVFLASVEEGGFAAAGRKLNRTRSAVGKAIARLEGEVGVRLFHRSSKKHKLTPEGEILYEQAKKTLADLEATIAALEAGRRSPTGVLRVTAPNALGRLVARPLTELAARYPELRIRMNFTDHVIGLIDEGIDLAVRVGVLGESATLKARRIASMEMVLCAAPAYLERFGVPRSLRDLPNHAAIVYGRGPFQIPWRLSEGTRRVAIEMPRERVRFDDLDAMCDAAVAGLGIAWLPAWLAAKLLRDHALEALMPDLRSEAFPVYAVWPAAPALPTRLRMAIDVLAERLPGLLSGNA